MSTTHSRVVELLNEASLETNEQAKVDCLLKVQELIIHHDPSLIETFLPEVLAFQHDRKTEVRKFVISFIEEACKANNELLPDVMKNLQLALDDPGIAVQKRVLQALTQIYKLTLGWMVRSKNVTDRMESAWNILSQMKQHALKMIDHDNDGVRTLAVKFYEMLIVLQTYQQPDSVTKEKEMSLDDVPLNLKIARPHKLEDEARAAFEDLIKFHGSAHISSANLMACMGSLTHIARSRPQLLGKIVTALEMLHANLPPTLAKSQVSSVRKHLKLQLLSILKHPAAFERSSTISTLLLELGASQHEINRAKPNPEEVAKYPRRTEKSEPRTEAIPTAKRRKVDEADEARNDSRRIPEQPQTTEWTEQSIVQKLTPEVAAELVVASLPRVPSSMPSRFASAYTPVTGAGSQTQIKHLARLLAAELSSTRPVAAVDSAGQLPPNVKVKEEMEEEMDVDDGVAYGDAGRARESDAAESRKPAVPLTAARAKPRPSKTSELAKPLSSEMQNSMAKAALKRLVKAERTAMMGGVISARQKILASLAALFHEDLSPILMDYINEDFRSRVELALSWLYEEYCWVMGFGRSSSSPNSDVRKTPEDYSAIFCGLVNVLVSQKDIKDRDLVLSRLFTEAPAVPDEGVKLLSSLFQDPTLTSVAMNIILQLIKRPNRRLAYLDVLLKLSNHEDSDARSRVLDTLVDCYKSREMRSSIDTAALTHLRYLLLNEPPAALFGAEKGREQVATTWTEDLIKACLHLLLVVLPENQKFIHDLAEVYVQAGADTKRTILRVVELPIKKMGMDSPELLKLVETCPKGAETLVTRIIHLLTDKYPPSAQLVERVRDLYQKRVPDVRFLIPVLNGLNKKEVLAALPKLIKLNPNVVKEVFNRLLGIYGEPQQQQHSPLSAAELLLALHNVDSNVCDMKTVMKATSLCFAERSVYTQEVIAVVLKQLVEQNPLPTLLMRTVLQSLTLYPRLVGFVMNILQTLILKQVWKQKRVWEGFVKCCQRTKPQSFAVLLQLPPAQLQDVLQSCPDLREPLLAHVMAFTENQRLLIPASLLDVLNGVAQLQQSLDNEPSSPSTEAGNLKEEPGSPDQMEETYADNEPPAPGDL